MLCPSCSIKLKFRYPGGRGNAENFSRRAKTVILKLICPQCHKKWLATDGSDSHPYQVRHKLPEGERKEVFSIRMRARDAARRRKRWGTLQGWADSVE